MSRDWRTTEQLMTAYQFVSRAAVRKFIARHLIPFTKRGRVTLVDKRDFDAACERMRQRAHGASA